jgi:tetratricopeptide (TPR) repeat protein
LAFVLAQDWDIAGVQREQRCSLELNPDLASVHTGRMMFNLISRRFDEAIAEARRAIELDPLSVSAAFFLGFAYHSAGRFNAAVEQMRKAIEIDPSNSRTHANLADAYACAGQMKKPLKNARKH